MPQTFSPMAIIVPVMAAPAAMPGQLFLATLVEPMAARVKGSLLLIPPFFPIVTSRSTFGNSAFSLSAAMPQAPVARPRIVKCDRSSG